MALVPTDGSFLPKREEEPVPALPTFGAPSIATSDQETVASGSAAAWGDIKARDDDTALRFRAATRLNPDQAAKANQLGRWTGAPPDAIERNLPEVQGNVTADAWTPALRDNPRLSRYVEDPRNAAASHDDLPAMKAISDQFHAFWGSDDAGTSLIRQRAGRESKSAMTADGWFDRLAASATSGLSQVEAGLFQVGGALHAWSANNPLPWTSPEKTAADQDQAYQMRTRARLLNGTAPIRGATSWADVKAHPFSPSNIAGFVSEQAAASVPGMATAAFALPAYVMSQAGSIGQYRAQNNNRTDADLADVMKAAPAAVASAILERIGIDKIFHATGGTVLRRIAGAAAGEGSTEFAQSSVEYAGGAAGTDKGFRLGDALDQGLQGALAGFGMGATFRGAHEAVADATTRYVQMRQGQAGADILNRIMTGAVDSKLRARDPEAFADFVQAQAAGTAAENVYIPAEAIRTLYQQEGKDWSDPNDDLLGPLSGDLKEQMEVGLASGGDIVLPVSQVAAHLAGTPTWDALQPHARIAPGGMSTAEAEAIEKHYSEEMLTRADTVAQMAQDEVAAMEPRARVFQEVLSQSRQNGFSLNAARSYADLWAERYQTRSERLNDGRTAHDLFMQSFAGMRSDLPGMRAAYGRSGQMDVLINAMRGGAEAAKPRGLDMLTRIMEGGGVEDKGGDIASMGGKDVARGGHFGRKRKPLIADHDPAQADLLGKAGGNENSLDAWGQRLFDEGYFPHLSERPDTNQVIDAIGASLRGEMIHPENPTMADETQNAVAQAAQDLASMLASRGLDPMTATKGQISQAMAEQEIADNSDRGFDQTEGQSAARGRIDFLHDNRAVITLFEGRDLSTILHEGGHLWLEELRTDGIGSPDSKVGKDWETVKAWFGKEGIDVDDATEIPVEAHELWARGMERYFMEGKAPSSALNGAFSSFRAWLLRIYQVVTRLNSNVTPEVRGVMDRLIATDSAIAWAIHEQDQKAFFDSAAGANMTPKEYSAYRELLEDSRTEAFDALLYRTMERIRRSRTQEYRDEERVVRGDVVDDVNARPEIRALNMLRGANGEEHRALDRESIIEIYGADALKLMPFGAGGKPAVRAGGMHPDLMAEIVGMPDGRTLLDALMGIEARRKELLAAGDKRSPVKEAVDIETDSRMAERKGDLFDKGGIEAEALDLIHNDKGMAVLAAEVRQLARTVGQIPSPLDAVKAWAERIVREGKIVDHASAAAVARHQRAERQAARAAEEAYLGGDSQTAFIEKQKQMVAMALYRASSDAKARIDVISRRMERLDRARTLKGMDQEYLERIHQLLENYDIRRRTKKDIKERESFDKWAKAQEEKGVEVFVPDRLLLAGNVNFTKLTVEQVTALDDAVQSLAHLGREKKSLLLAQEERDFNALIEEAQGVAQNLPLRSFSNARNQKPSWARQMDAMLTKVEFLADQLDGNNPNGVFNRILVQASTHAANEKERLIRKVVQPLADIYNGMSSVQQRRMGQRVSVPEFMQLNPATGLFEAQTFTRMELLAVALNTGNESNLEKMLVGETLAFPQALRGQFGWTEEKVMSVLNRELTKEDWDFAQKVWDQINELWPDIAKSERDISGVAPEKIEARKVATAYGTYSGGYYPVIFDPARSQIASENLEQDAQALMGQMGRSVSTPKGHTITRTEAAMPLHYSVERVLLNHINRVATRVAYGRYVRDALKFINEPRIRSIVDQHAGLEYHKQLKPWLQRQVNEAAMDTNTISALDRILRTARVNATAVGLGFRATTMISQTAGWANSANEIGPKYLLKGMAEMARNMGSIRSWVFSQSPEMAGRAQAFDRDVHTFFNDIGRINKNGRGGVGGALSKVDDALHLDTIRSMGFWGIGMIDVYLVAMPTWIGAYHKGLDEGMSSEEASSYGDKAVRRSQGAGRAKDLAAVQAGPEASRIFTTFYSYFSVLYNQQRDTIHAARSGDWRRAAMNVFWIMMVAPLASALLTGDGPQDQEDEGWLTWAMRKMFFGLWGGVPLLRDAGSVIERKMSGQFAGSISTPIARAFDEIQRPVNDAIKLHNGDEVSDRWLRNVITPIGYFTGLPTGQAGATAQYAHDVATGLQHPQGVADVVAGVAKGPREDQE